MKQSNFLSSYLFGVLTISRCCLYRKSMWDAILNMCLVGMLHTHMTSFCCPLNVIFTSTVFALHNNVLYNMTRLNQIQYALCCLHDMGLSHISHRADMGVQVQGLMIQGTRQMKKFSKPVSFFVER